MKKETIVWILIGPILFCALVVIASWFFNNKGRNWVFENKETKCLTQPWATVPSQIPQRSDYEYGDSFKDLVYKMPSWWERQSVRGGILTADTHALYKKMKVVGKNVWLTYFSSGNQIARFDTQTGEVIPYRIMVDGKEPNDVTDLYVSHDGTLWITLGFLGPKIHYSALARYRQDKDGFEVIADKDGLLDQSHLSSAIGDVDEISDKHIGELPDGKLAFILGRNVYLYNPKTNQARLILDKDKNEEVETIVVGNNGSIWFEKFSDYPSESGFNLMRLNPETGQITDYGVAPQMSRNIKTQPELRSAAYAITIDRQEQVWVSYFDRLEPSPTSSIGEYSWDSINLPPLFVSKFDPWYTYRWANIFSTNVFSDGNIWFASDIGIVKYDVKNESWCLSAVIKTLTFYPITEDAEGNIWTVVDRQLYKIKP